MAKSKRSRSSEPAARVSEPPRKRGGGNALLSLLIVLAAGGGYVTWHRKKDPSRQWARRVEQAREQKVVSKLEHCFGGADAAAVRAVITEVRHGSVPTPFRGCNLTELLIAPGTFVEDIANPPSAAASTQFREREALEAMHGSVAQLQRAMGGVDRTHPVPDDARDRIATALEDVAVDVDREQSRFHDLVNAADASASWW